jgi:outer membrane biosynthesis protein TonB
MAAEVRTIQTQLNWRPWVLALLLALVWHAAWLLPKIHWSPPLAPPRVDIKTIDPAKLAAIRRKWDQQKQLLLSRDKSPPTETEAPPDAKFMSDRNRRVEKEQRARETVTVPKPGGPRVQNLPKVPRFPEMPKLGNLGIPLPVPKPTSDSAGRADPNREEGGQQYVKDPTVPEGSENILNSQESIYYSFYARLYDSIAPIWQSRIREIPPRRILGGDYTTVVDVIFDREGNLVGVERTQTSGVDEFDRAVNDAWRRVGRFPNPPSGLLDSQGQVHTGWSFTVRIQDGIPFDVLPPERSY